uniref:Reverse transcriptase domain-containing protein n=1 Tax=Strongyloides papillosus TaxID=174720 RepID=A0A0N5C170_STREA
MPRSTRSTNPIESNSSNLSDLYKDIQHRAHSEALKNNMSGNSGDGDDVTRHNNRPGGQLTGTLNPEKNGNNQQPPLGFNMEQLQTIINDMIQNAILNFANKNQVPPANAATIAQFHPTAASTNETGNVLSQINGNETRQFLPTITDRVTSVIMPDKFTVKDNFSKWEIKFNSYCRMNRIKEEDKLDTLILLLDNTVLQEIYDNPLLRNNYQQLTLYLSENFNGGISIQAATDELELLVGKRVQKPDDLDHVAKKIDRYIDIKFPCDSRERKNREKLMYLAKTLPSAIQNSYFCSSKNTLDEGVAIAKKIWIQEIRAERDKARGFSIIKSHKPTDKNQRYQRNNSSQYCSYCKMNNHTNATCRNKNRVKGQSNNIEVTENQVNNIEVSKDLLPSMNINKLEEHLPTNEVSFDKLNDSPPNMNLDDSWNYVTYKNKNNKKLKESPSTVNIVEQPLSKNASTTKSHVNVPAENMSIDESHNKVSCLNINVDRSANNVSLINMNNNQSPEKLSCINTNVNESPINVSHMNTNLDESDKLEKPLPQNQSFRETLHKISTKDNLIGAVVKINDVNVISLIDTGSNCLIISNKLKDKLNLVTCNESQISTYQSSNAAYKIETPITIQIQKESFTLTDNIYAAKENFKNDSYDAIIGTNILKRLMAVIDLQTENQSPTTNVILGNQDDNVNINEFVDKLKLKYPLAYAKHAFDIGPGKIVVNEIEIYENKEMIKAPYYSVPIHEKDSISQLLNCWIENGLLEKSSSNLIHPIMLITKNNDKNDFESRRFIADLRQVNSITKPVNYNTPKIQELLQSLNAFSFITKIDLKSAFFQLSLPENSRKLYGIRTIKRKV